MLKVVAEKAASEEPAFGIDEICREGARRMLAVALEAEVDAYVAEHLEDQNDLGHRLVVCSGRAGPRRVKTVAGAVGVEAPRVNDKRVDAETGERQKPDGERHAFPPERPSRAGWRPVRRSRQPNSARCEASSGSAGPRTSLSPGRPGMVDTAPFFHGS